MAKRKPTELKPIPVCDYLKEKRFEAGVTQFEAARALGHVTPQYVSNFERYICKPSLEMILVLAKLYRIPKQELFDTLLSIYEERLRESIFPTPPPRKKGR